jgi:oxaloacetate decarboxylase gamma subunit
LAWEEGRLIYNNEILIFKYNFDIILKFVKWEKNSVFLFGGYMTISEMLSQSGLLTLLGMCVVFGFIIILIGCMKLLQIAVSAFKLDKDEKTNATVNVSASPATPQVPCQDLNVIAAIAAAVHDKELNS